jgi:hypothetical protein
MFNPIYYIINCNNLLEIKNKVKILNNFKLIFNLIKYKQKFIKWYWKSQETKIQTKYSPENLLLLLNNNTDLENLLEVW